MTTATIQYINTGTSANKGDGDSLRAAFTKVNKNFELLGTTTGFDTNAVKDTISEMFLDNGAHYGISFIYNTGTHEILASLTTATHTRIGGVKIGSGIDITPDGVISAATAYVLPIATSNIIGGVRVGSGLTVDQFGVLSNAGVTSFNNRTGPVTLSSLDISGALGFDPASAFTIGFPNGIASLDGNGKVPTSQLPEGVLGSLNYQGTWNARDNLPALSSGIGTKGFYYKVSIAGTTSVDNLNVWNVGDLILFNGARWDKIDGILSEVTSVAGRTGDITLTYADLGGYITGAVFSATTTATNLVLGTIKVGYGLTAAGDGTVQVDSALIGSTLPATTSTLGTIKVGNGLSIQPDGTLSAILGNAADITFVTNEIRTVQPNEDMVLRPTSGVVHFYNTLVSSAGNNGLVLRTNPFLNAGIATDATNFSMRLVGDSNAGTVLFDAGIYNSPIATTGWTSKLLLRKNGDAILAGNLQVKGTNGITFSDGSTQLTAAVITTATTTALGGVIVGAGLQIDGTGILSTVLGSTGGQITNLGAGAPATSADTGSPGQVLYDGSYMYLCVAINTWIRVPITPADVPGAW